MVFIRLYFLLSVEKVLLKSKAWGESGTFYELKLKRTYMHCNIQINSAKHQTETEKYFELYLWKDYLTFEMFK